MNPTQLRQHALQVAAHISNRQDSAPMARGDRQPVVDHNLYSKKRHQMQERENDQIDGYGRIVRHRNDLEADTASTSQQLTLSSAVWKPSRCATDFLALEDGIWCDILSYTDQVKFLSFRHLNRRFHRLTHVVAAYPAKVQLRIGNNEQQVQQVADSLALNSKSLACLTHLQVTLPSHSGDVAEGHDARCMLWSKLLQALVATFNGDLLPAGRHLALNIQLDMSTHDDNDDDLLYHLYHSRVACQHHYMLCTSFNNLRELVVSSDVRWTDDTALLSECCLASASTLKVLLITLTRPSQAFVDALPLLSLVQRLTLKLDLDQHASRSQRIDRQQINYTPLSRMSTTLQCLDIEVLDWRNHTYVPALMALTQRIPALVLARNLQMPQVMFAISDVCKG